MKKILFINHNNERCGVFQFGDVIAQGLVKYQKQHQWSYYKADGPVDFFHAYNIVKPDVLIFNWFPTTMGWYDEIKNSVSAIKIGIIHELNQVWGDNFYPTISKFDYAIMPDPTFKNSQYWQPTDKVFTTNRGIPDYIPKEPPAEFTAGSFGFGMDAGKYFALIDRVQSEFELCKIRLHIPYASFGDNEGNAARDIAAKCQHMIFKPGISLEVSHDFLSREQLLDWLSANSINCFFYGGEPGRGIASTPDYGLAVRRPMALTNSTMFRHIDNPKIRIENQTLRGIYSMGVEPLIPYYDWTLCNLTKEYEDIIDAI